ncbi:MAG: type II toxin-antitoxin system VapC family toxin [Defluviitaleaceae bacterium]|nr:type II toxin-antitoxin system VapC family toxin [Defluviitaleaceae bacterium]
MKYLFDTHTFLWYFWDSKDLSECAADIIEDDDVQKYVSIASLWEFAIKYGMGKLKFDGGLTHLWDMLSQNGFIFLPITRSQLEALISELPLHHRDPFDRLIIATAIAEELTIVTVDENIQKYDVPWVW